MDNTENYAVYEINNMLIVMMSAPKKGGGFFPLINKWIKTDKYDLQYVYFVISKIFNKYQKQQINFTVGYIEEALKKSVDEYDPERNRLPHSNTREELLNAGLRVENLPHHLLTSEERKNKQKIYVGGEADVDGLKKFLGGINDRC